jgi:cell wall-associated NlpC family hydrolase
MSLKVFSVKIRLLIFGFLLLSISGCLKAQGTIKDIADLRQDHAVYLSDSSMVKNLMALEDQSQLDEDYNIIYFSVWHQRQPFYALSDRVHLDFIKFGENPGFGENKLKHSKDWLKRLKQNASLNNYPNAGHAAITTRNTSLRSLPTQRPHFSSPQGDSAGWPFDNLQRSSVAANTPIFVCHISADKSWALVETSFTFGWIPAEDFARVDTDFIKSWERGRYAVITRDQTSILDKSDRFILKASLGYIFPLIKATEGSLEVLTAVADKNNNAVIKHGFVSQELSAVKPLRLTSHAAVKIANELIGESYGWGGLYGNRDCSSMTRDFFAPFGIWLPRHSEDQVKEVGIYVSLQDLDPEQKEKNILEKGVPYLSLLWRKGHVMLYIGQHRGQALIFHNIWGIKTKDLTGKEGRKIIGQAVITTLRPGDELSCIDPEGGTLLKAITAMNILVPEKINQDQSR